MAAPFLDAFRGRRCLVTGHTGFKGTWLTLWLHRLGAEVAGLALPPDHSQALFGQVGLGDRIASSYGDVRHRDDVAAAFARHRPEIVFHLAAQALVRRGYDDPLGTFATNVLGTAHVLEAVRRHPGVAAVVVVTSDKCYRLPGPRGPLSEDDPLGGTDPYAASKAAAELVTAAYRESFFASGPALVASARAGNVIGAGDGAPDRLVPDVVRALRAGVPVVLRHPEATRPWQHVLEPLRGYLMLAARLLGGDAAAARAWNFGPAPDAAVTVEDLARRVLAAWGGGELTVTRDPEAPSEAAALALDSTLARRHLGYEPILDLNAAVTLTVAGYRALERPDGAATLDDQIADYTTRIT